MGQVEPGSENYTEVVIVADRPNPSQIWYSYTKKWSRSPTTIADTGVTVKMSGYVKPQNPEKLSYKHEPERQLILDFFFG